VSTPVSGRDLFNARWTHAFRASADRRNDDVGTLPGRSPPTEVAIRQPCAVSNSSTACRCNDSRVGKRRKYQSLVTPAIARQFVCQLLCHRREGGPLSLSTAVGRNEQTGRRSAGVAFFSNGGKGCVRQDRTGGPRCGLRSLRFRRSDERPPSRAIRKTYAHYDCYRP
jgi:hypothetical protein